MSKHVVKFALGALAVAAMSAASPVSAAAPNAGGGAVAPRAVGVTRVTLVVSDLEKSVDFYQRVGLLKAADAAQTDTDQGGVFGSIDLPLTAESKQSRIVYMMTPGSGGMIALLSYDKPPLPSARGNLVGIGIGDVIVSIEVPDVQAAHGRLSQIGTRFQRTPVRFSQPGPDGATQTGQHLLAYDPDGHMVEVSQMDRR